MKVVLAAASLMLIAGAAWADDEYDRCIDQSDGTNVAWDECGGKWIAREDKKLNAAWKKLLTGASEQTKADLRKEQRAWNDYKELSCLFYANGELGRQGQVLDLPRCRAQVIAKRAAELEAYEGDYEGQ